MKLYDNSKKFFINQPIFLGEGRNIQRYDIMKYPEIYKLGEKMDSQFWKPGEISLAKDVIDYKNLSSHEQRIANLNWKRQTVLDSVQGRSILSTFGRVITNSEVEYTSTRVQFQETNHSDTYSYILRAVFDNPSEVLDSILDDEIISKHTTTITDKYDELYDLINKWESYPNYQNKNTKKQLKKAIYLALIAWNILEGVRFYVSFACTFAFAENKLMEGNAKELKLIARDENSHLAFTQRLLQILHNNPDEGFQDVINECQEEAVELYRIAAEEEIQWAEYLFEDGSIIGLNSSILIRYMKYLTNKRMKAVKLPKLFENIGNNNPLPWMKAWLGEERIEERAQETQLSSYAIGIVKDDIKW